MEQEYEDKCNDQQTKITSIETYYEEIIRNQSPRHVMKHWVKNKDSRGKYIACPRYLFFGLLSDCTSVKLTYVIHTLSQAAHASGSPMLIS